MNNSGGLRSGKGSGDENFPVASRLIARKHRPVILAFYEFVRTADDIADHATLTHAEKFAHLNSLERSLVTGDASEPEGVALCAMLAERNLTNKHALDLLSAFRQDVTKNRYETWAELIDYCSRSAMPVGRFVLDVHGESPATWPASDALCAALQIINHLQDCGEDYRNLDRVYLPREALDVRHAAFESLGAEVAPPVLLACIRDLVTRTQELLARSDGFAASINDLRLSLEVAAIHSLARRLCGILLVRDPLSDETHLGKWPMLGTALCGGAGLLIRRLLGVGANGRRYQPS
ncbi:MAG: squalene synthase HpnC [Pseudolabrys sp.]|nr:squalene synthase HpnC [Pseudolabrys sp.]